MRRGRALVFRLLAIVLGLAVAEGGLRLAGLAYPAWDRPTPGLGEWGVPNARGWAVGETRQWVELNAEGARDVDHAVAKPPDVHRIVVLGDSYAAAFEVARDEAFWSVMGERLGGDCAALSGRRVEVINLSKRGYGTADELLLWRALGAKYAPDQVVLAFYTGNDFRNNSPELKAADRPYFRIVGDALVLDASHEGDPSFRFWTGWPGDLWYGLVRHVRLIQVARHLRRQIKAGLELRDLQARAADAETASAATVVAGSEGAGRGTTAPRRALREPGLDEAIYLEPRDARWHAAWTISERLVRQLRDEVEAGGARFLLMTLSTAAQVHPDPSVRAATAEQIGVADLDYPERRFEAWSREQGIRWLSAVPALRRAAETGGECVHGFPGPYACQGHWNALGHRVAGEALARAVCDQLASTRAGVSPGDGSTPRDRSASDQAPSRSPTSIERASLP